MRTDRYGERANTVREFGHWHFSSSRTWLAKPIPLERKKYEEGWKACESGDASAKLHTGS